MCLPCFFVAATATGPAAVVFALLGSTMPPGGKVVWDPLKGGSARKGSHGCLCLQMFACVPLKVPGEAPQGWRSDVISHVHKDPPGRNSTSLVMWRLPRPHAISELSALPTTTASVFTACSRLLDEKHSHHQWSRPPRLASTERARGITVPSLQAGMS